MNRANGRTTLFESAACYRDFINILNSTLELHQTSLVAYCLMPNHWHMVLSPQTDGDLPRFVKRFTIRQTQRLHAYRETAGRGHLYKGRYKSVVVRDDHHLLTLCRYVERNPLRAGLVARAEDWRWSSALSHIQAAETGTLDCSGSDQIRLDALPLRLPTDWRALLNEDPPNDETEAVRRSIEKGVPLGDEDWRETIAARLAVPANPRGRGRPSLPTERKKGVRHLFGKSV